MSRGLKISAAILLFGLIAGWVGTEIWVSRWERRWEDFLVLWQEKGENFAYQPTPQVPDSENYAEHFFVRKLRAGDKITRERVGLMDPQRIDAYTAWKYSLSSEDEPEIPIDAARQIISFYQTFQPELDAMAEAAQRPGIAIREQRDENSGKPQWLMLYESYCSALFLRGRAAQALGDLGLRDECILTLLKTARHLQSCHQLLEAAAGTSFEMDAYILIKGIPSIETITEAHKIAWLEEMEKLSSSRKSKEAVIMRNERFQLLHELDSLQKEHSGELASLWLPRVKRVEVAKLRLAMCQPLQDRLLAPGGLPLAEIRESDSTSVSDSISWDGKNDIGNGLLLIFLKIHSRFMVADSDCADARAKLEKF